MVGINKDGRPNGNAVCTPSISIEGSLFVNVSDTAMLTCSTLLLLLLLLLLLVATLLNVAGACQLLTDRFAVAGAAEVATQVGQDQVESLGAEQRASSPAAAGVQQVAGADAVHACIDRRRVARVFRPHLGVTTLLSLTHRRFQPCYHQILTD